MKTQNLKFGETVRMLANLAGMQPFIFSKEQDEKEKKFKSYVSVYADYISICHNNIISKSNQKIMEYLNKSIQEMYNLNPNFLQMIQQY